MNVGVVVHCPETGYFAHQLLPPTATQRIQQFFPELDLATYHLASAAWSAELARVSASLQILSGNAERTRQGMAHFRELVRPRETTFRYSSGSSALAKNPAILLAELFRHYVTRSSGYADVSSFEERLAVAEDPAR